MLKKDKSSFIGVSLILLFFIFDYASKLYIVNNFKFGESVSIIKGFFDIVYIRNRGVAFGFLSNLPEIYRIIFLCGISLIVFLIIIYLILFGKNRNLAYIIGLSLLGGGAVGNLYERIVKGYVVDFLDFYIKNYHYPAFNLADSFITVGVFVLIFSRIKIKQVDSG